jgi:anaerobic selenocysteine-containing dehydrogenase
MKRPTREMYNPPLQVTAFLATRRGDAERGPAILINADEARARGLVDGELVFVIGPRRKELADLRIDDTVPRGGATVRDIAGLTVTEVIKLVKPEQDQGPTATKPMVRFV